MTAEEKKHMRMKHICTNLIVHPGIFLAGIMIGMAIMKRQQAKKQTQETYNQDDIA